MCVIECCLCGLFGLQFAIEKVTVEKEEEGDTNRQKPNNVKKAAHKCCIILSVQLI